MRRKILLVDDDPVLLKLVSFMLQQGGFQITTSADGNRALELIKKESFDLMILDINIPGVEGFDILETVRKSESNNSAPVIMLSSRNDSMSVLKAKALGADDYMVKPPKREVLMDKVTNLIGRKPQEMELLFEENDERSQLVVPLPMVLRSLSATGIILYSHTPFESGYVIKDALVDVFSLIKIPTPQIKVIECSPTSAPKMKHFKYEIYGSLFKVPEKDLEILREWIISTSLKEKAYSSMAKAGGE